MRYGNIANENERFVCVTFDRGDMIDPISYGMVTNNCIQHLLSVGYRREGTEDVFYYDVRGYVTLAEYIKMNHDIDTMKSIYASVCDTVYEISMYMLKKGSLIWDDNYIYIEPFTREIRFMLIPSEAEVMPDIDLRVFLLKLHGECNNTEALNGWKNEVGKYLQNERNFSIQYFRELIFRAGSSYVKKNESDYGFNPEAETAVLDPAMTNMQGVVVSQKKSFLERLFPGREKRRKSKRKSAAENAHIQAQGYNYYNEGYGETVVLKRIS